jgi:hypothetical protein
MKDLHNKIEVVQLLAPVSVTATGSITDIDLAGWNSAELIIDIGADSGTGLSATDYWTFTLKDSPDGTTYTAVADADMLGVTGITAGAILTVDSTDEDNTLYHFGYVGGKRYLELTYTETTTGSNTTLMSVTLVKGNPQDAPVIA